MHCLMPLVRTVERQILSADVRDNWRKFARFARMSPYHINMNTSPARKPQYKFRCKYRLYTHIKTFYCAHRFFYILLFFLPPRLICIISFFFLFFFFLSLPTFLRIARHIIIYIIVCYIVLHTIYNIFVLH